MSVGLIVLLLLDRQTRMRAADRQSLTMATGVDRLLHLELRNIERALGGIAADVGDDPVPVLVQEAIAGVVARHAEIASIVLYDAHGRALSGGPDAPALRVWQGAPHPARRDYAWAPCSAATPAGSCRSCCPMAAAVGWWPGCSPASSMR
ncbi:hypothetical protein BEN78_00930 [Xanthomonas citri pv. mangiferaeindicae]|nr:hypothetical protein BEN78_00930 [Xanthomonas citri pv. mangiferaeindicae]